MKRIYEMAAARSLQAIVIMRGARLVAKVLVHSGSGGRVTVEVIQRDEACQRCEAAAAKALKRAPRDADAARTQWGLQRKSVEGYGYDKVTAALAGMRIDGHLLADHATPYPKRGPLPYGNWPRDAKPPRGFCFANLRPVNPEKPEGAWAWADCYQQHGLEYLRELGYNVIQVL